MKIKTKELTGAVLDWAVAKAKGEEHIFWLDWAKEAGACYSPSGFWVHGGSIIEREKIQILPRSADWVAVRFGPGKAITGTTPLIATGTTPLIAACRCYVASKLGDEVDVPEGLQ